MKFVKHLGNKKPSITICQMNKWLEDFGDESYKGHFFENLRGVPGLKGHLLVSLVSPTKIPKKTLGLKIWKLTTMTCRNIYKKIGSINLD